jgi:K+-sensing histidine kinase KdpD
LLYCLSEREKTATNQKEKKMDNTMSLAVIFLIAYAVFATCWVKLFIYYVKTKEIGIRLLGITTAFVLSSMVMFIFTAIIIRVAFQIFG